MNIKNGKQQKGFAVMTKEQRRKIASMGGKSHLRYGKWSQSSEYDTWRAMIARCNNPKSTGYSRYGGRGIYVVKRWLVFTHFIADMGGKPTPEHTLDRIDNNGPYSPENCRWATWDVQYNNRRQTRKIIWNGKIQSLTQWARELGMNPKILSHRIVDKKWTIERAFTETVKPRKKRLQLQLMEPAGSPDVASP